MKLFLVFIAAVNVCLFAIDQSLWWNAGAAVFVFGAAIVND